MANIVTLHNHKKGNNYLVANMVANVFNCKVLAAEDNPSISSYDIVIIIVPNTGDEELPQPMEDYLLSLKDRNKQYAVCELGNYFGFENYCGCKKVVFKLLECLAWTKLADISIDSLPSIDMPTLGKWLRELHSLIMAETACTIPSIPSSVSDK